MSPLLIKICKDFATIWTTIDPIGHVAIFAGLTASLTQAERHRTALRASLYALRIVRCFARKHDKGGRTGAGEFGIWDSQRPSHQLS
jgi:small neutral amino acid transporter SnatA (MarC family)